MKLTAIILAAGKGSRMNSQIEKQFMMLGGYPVIYYALRAFEQSKADDVVLVTGQESIEYCKREIVEMYGFRKVAAVVAGGANRYDSVANGLKACKDTDLVLIHDGARPFVTQDMIDRVTDTLRTYPACTVGMPVKDTIKVVDADGIGICTPARDTLWQIQTPQGFHYELLVDAYRRMYEALQSNTAKEETPVTDDTMLVERYKATKVKVVEGSYTNIKLTTPDDMEIGERILFSISRVRSTKKCGIIGGQIPFGPNII